MKRIILIKLGGSLITDKKKPYTAHISVIKHLALQIKAALDKDKNLQLIIGNGAGSFGHYEAHRYKIKDGLASAIQKKGMCVVHAAVAHLNNLVVKELIDAGVPAFSLQPSAMMLAEGGKQKGFFFDTLMHLIKMNVVPVVYGDIVPDTKKGSHIFSTEKVLGLIAKRLHILGKKVEMVIHIGSTPGVLDKNGNIIPVISEANLSAIQSTLLHPEGYDVTGGMRHKISESLQLVHYGIKNMIIGVYEKGDIVKRILLGESVPGTLITVKNPVS